jgi:hypothetical protein
MTAHEAHKDVGNVRNNDPELLLSARSSGSLKELQKGMAMDTVWSKPGFCRGFAENALALSVYPQESTRFLAPSFILGPDGTGNLISAIRESYLSIWVNCGQYQSLGIHKADGIC